MVAAIEQQVPQSTLPTDAGACASGDLQGDFMRLRGELSVTRGNLERERNEIIELESRLRAERDKADDLQKDIERRDDKIADLSTRLQSHDRIEAAQGRDADTFEAVLAEEMEHMRQAYEQKLATLRTTIDREQLTFSRERKEGREAYEKEIRALRRRVEILTSKAGHLVDHRELMTPSSTPR